MSIIISKKLSFENRLKLILIALTQRELKIYYRIGDFISIMKMLKKQLKKNL